jgi:hypothetical protein
LPDPDVLQRYLEGKTGHTPIGIKEVALTLLPVRQKIVERPGSVSPDYGVKSRDCGIIKKARPNELWVCADDPNAV